MKLAEALKVRSRAPKDAPPFHVVLACGITPLHLQTFVHAHLQLLLPSRRVVIETGLYNDLPNTLDRAARAESIDAVLVVIEWSDIDVRLGLRSAGKWGHSVAADIALQSQHSFDRLSHLLASFPPHVRVVVAPPALASAPAFGGPASCAAPEQLQVAVALSTFLYNLSLRPGLSIVDCLRLASEPGVGPVCDARSDLATGFPYTLEFTNHLAAAAALLLSPGIAKKGIITDLDDTMWHGIAGDDGPDAVSWSLADHHSIHGRYQRVLASLAEQGTLLAAATKNDPQVVEAVFRRDDILLPGSLLFPVEANWGPKSESVQRILSTWNLGPEGVVFVDDNPLELAEVQRSFPHLLCLLFPKDNAGAFTSFVHKLLNLCGKVSITDEDKLRAASIRGSVGVAKELSSSQSPANTETFLLSLESKIRFQLTPNPDDSRILELVNKTNQFNLNGIRYSASEWLKLSAQPGSFVLSVSYEDRFGPLGKIAVIAGKCEGEFLSIHAWVMSCRAFSRRIEHQCCRFLFDHFSVNRIQVQFVPTARNAPMKEFLSTWGAIPDETPLCLTRACVDAAMPVLHAQLQIA